MPSFPDGFQWLQQYFDADRQRDLLVSIRDVIATTPLYRPTMPRTGKPFSIQMTNCGPLGWVSDKYGGYRYQATHPSTGRPWPAIPGQLLDLWSAVSGFPAAPEACLINYYEPSNKMGSHTDSDEQTFEAPVVSISLGSDATFHIGGLKRSGPKQRIRIASGDVVVMGGASRVMYHGIDRVFPGTSTLLPDGCRINLTLRRVTPC